MLLMMHLRSGELPHGRTQMLRWQQHGSVGRDFQLSMPLTRPTEVWTKATASPVANRSERTVAGSGGPIVHEGWHAPSSCHFRRRGRPDVGGAYQHWLSSAATCW